MCPRPTVPNTINWAWVGGLKIIEIYSLTVFKDRSTKPKYWQAMLPSKSPKGESFFDFS